jgi:hypothetical protein
VTSSTVDDTSFAVGATDSGLLYHELLRLS